MRRRSLLTDWLIAWAFGVVAIAELWFTGPIDPLFDRMFTTAMVAAMAGAVGFRTTAPFRAFVANGVAMYLTSFFGVPGGIYPAANAVLLLAVAMSCDDRRARWALGLSGLGIAAYFFNFGGEDGWLMAAASGLLWLAVWLAGRALADRRRAETLERERDLSRQLAATAEERARLEQARHSMAREVHDLVGHSINVMVVHAGAGRLALPDAPATARSSFETIEEVGRKALIELDRVLGILRDGPDAARAPLPGLADLGDLVDGLATSGPTVHVRQELGDGSIPVAVGATVFRLVQEALTNAVKHASASHVEVEIQRLPDRVEAAVADDGRGPDGPLVTGRGLGGMRERVEMLGGSLRVGAGPNGGFEVRASIPLEPIA